MLMSTLLSCSIFHAHMSFSNSIKVKRKRDVSINTYTMLTASKCEAAYTCARGSVPSSPIQNVSLGQQTIPSGAHTRVSTTRESPPGPPLRTSTSDPPSVAGSINVSSTPASSTRPRARAGNQAALGDEIARAVGYALLLSQGRFSIAEDPHALELRLSAHLRRLLLKYNGDAIEIGFNVTYLIDALSNMSQDMVKLELSDGNSSALFTIPDNATFKYVVMPMRI